MAKTIFKRIMWLARGTSMVLGLAVMLALVMGVASMAFAATGGNFILGQSNTADKVTKLIRSGAGAALDLRVEQGSPPLKVNSDTKVANLNADKLDGLNSSDFQGKYAQTVVVAKSGGDFTSVQAALDSITDASDSKHYLVWVAPGTYNEQVQMKPFVDIEGSGELATKITASGGGEFGAGGSVVSGASDAELRHLTAENTGGSSGGASTYAMGIFNGSASPRLSNVTATATGEGAEQITIGVENLSSSPTMTDVTATGSGSNAAGNAAFGVANSGGSFPTMTDVTATGSGAPYNVGVNNGGSSPTMTDVTATASGGDAARGMENSTSSPKMTNVTVTASGGSTENTGMQNGLSSSPTIRESVISASGTASRGVWSKFPGDTTSVVTIDNSEVKGPTNTIKAEGGYKVNVGASKLYGSAVSIVDAGSAVKCAGVHDENYTFSAGPTCP